MFTESTVAKLAAMTWRADAERQVCWLPLSGIFWTDEMPDVKELVAIREDDRILLLRLFAIRSKVWRRESLSADEQRLWEETRSQAPTWAFWQREEVSAEDLQAQDDAERATAEGLSGWFADADKVEISEKDGVQSFSATFDLTRLDSPPPKEQSIWKRMFKKRR